MTESLGQIRNMTSIPRASSTSSRLSNIAFTSSRIFLKVVCEISNELRLILPPPRILTAQSFAVANGEIQESTTSCQSTSQIGPVGGCRREWHDNSTLGLESYGVCIDRPRPGFFNCCHSACHSISSCWSPECSSSLLLHFHSHTGISPSRPMSLNLSLHFLAVSKI